MRYGVTLPLPPSSNHIYVRRAKVYFKGGKKKRRVMDVLSTRAQEWMADARDRAVSAMGPWVATDKVKVVVECKVYWPDRRRRDCHNLSKLLCDALEGAVCKDDQYMLLRYMDFELDKDNPRVEVVAYEAGEPCQ